ncbi:hypothetical protein RchiOBHm_Chr7g0204481 [Rosa chinensis]|uniref:Uncharacterized protein n=1 Tax=Rosa chinensis TaxID=74649 RepID=A0A2P6P8P5_ROSCH|nr:hypothetical protein RchiOBHm_Chr7g0204481 [Rosa chinensis]
METLIDWIDSEVNMSTTYVLFRTYAPVHFRILNGEDVDIEETVLRTPISKS